MTELIHKAAREYMIETETFDREYLTGRLTPDGKLPASSQERIMSNKNSALTKNKKIAEVGCTANEFTRALLNYQRSQEYRDDMNQLGFCNE